MPKKKKPKDTMSHAGFITGLNEGVVEQIHGVTFHLAEPEVFIAKDGRVFLPCRCVSTNKIMFKDVADMMEEYHEQTNPGSESLSE